jgi:hypothetical protein
MKKFIKNLISKLNPFKDRKVAFDRFRITYQRTLFRDNEQITENNRTQTSELGAQEYKKILNEAGLVKSISFLHNNNEIIRYDILGDPYYKLEKYDNGKWIEIDKHKH